MANLNQLARGLLAADGLVALGSAARRHPRCGQRSGVLHEELLVDFGAQERSAEESADYEEEPHVPVAHLR